MLNTIRSFYLKPGEIFYGEDPIVVNTLLGSCVSITMYAHRIKSGMISHCMLPSSTESIRQGENTMKYVDCALLYMNKKMQSTGTEKRETEVKLFGGSNMFYGADAESGVGSKNIAAAVTMLKKLGYSIKSSDTGGEFTRRLCFSIDTGMVYLRKTSKIKEP